MLKEREVPSAAVEALPALWAGETLVGCPVLSDLGLIAPTPDSEITTRLHPRVPMSTVTACAA